MVSLSHRVLSIQKLVLTFLKTQNCCCNRGVVLDFVVEGLPALPHLNPHAALHIEITHHLVNCRGK